MDADIGDDNGIPPGRRHNRGIRMDRHGVRGATIGVAARAVEYASGGVEGEAGREGVTAAGLGRHDGDVAVRGIYRDQLATRAIPRATPEGPEPGEPQRIDALNAFQIAFECRRRLD